VVPVTILEVAVLLIVITFVFLFLGALYMIKSKGRNGRDR
jgi:hypothetical protein